MERSSRASSSGWGGTGPGFVSGQTTQADSRQQPTRSAEGGTLMDLVASSSRSRLPPSAGTLPPRSDVPPSPGPFANSPFVNSPWDTGPGIESSSHGDMPPSPSGTWRQSLGGGDLMSVLIQGSRLSQPPQFQSPATFTATGHGLDGGTWPPLADTGSRSAALPAMPASPAGSWRDSLGGDDLMSVLIQGSRLSQPTQAHPPDMASPLGGEWGGSAQHLPTPSGHPMATPAGAASSSPRGSQQWPMPGMPTAAESGTLLDLVNSGWRAGTVQSPAGHEAGSWTGAWNDPGPHPPSLGDTGSGARGAAPGDSASQVPQSEPNSVQRLGIGSRISQQDFDRARDLIGLGLSTPAALASIGRSDIPLETMRRWIKASGLRYTTTGVKQSLTAQQINTARAAQEAYISHTGTTRKSARAAYNALNDPSINYSSFRNYFSNAGLTAHGTEQLEAAKKRSESGPAGGTGP